MDPGAMLPPEEIEKGEGENRTHLLSYTPSKFGSKSYKHLINNDSYSWNLHPLNLAFK